MDNKVGYITGKEFMEMDSLKNSRCLSDKTSTDVKIESVNIIEVPDIINWTKKGELLITTGYPFKNNPEELLSLMRQLPEVGVVGMAIKPRRFINEISKEMIEIADENKLILIEHAQDVAFTDVVYEATQKIISRSIQVEYDVQFRLNMIYSKIPQDGGAREYIDAIEWQLGCSVFVADENNDLVYTDSGKEKADYIREILPIIRQRERDNGTITFDGNRIYVCSAKSRSGDILIMSLEGSKKFSESDIMVLNNISHYLAVAVRNEITQIRLKNQYKNRFVLDWVMGLIKTPEDIIFFADNCGYHVDVDAKYCVAIVDISSDADSFEINRVKRTAKIISERFYTTICESRIIVVMQVESMDNIHRLLSEFRNVISETVGKELSIYVGGLHSITDVNSAYLEALNVHKISKKCNISESIVTYEHLGIYSILSLLPEHEEVNRYKQRFIEPVIEYDKVHKSELMRTLDMYFKCRQNAKKAANEMYIHYNTFLYRLDRIRQILKLDIENPNIQLQLQIAMKLVQIDQADN